jgi:hypothetical protein
LNLPTNSAEDPFFRGRPDVLFPIADGCFVPLPRPPRGTLAAPAQLLFQDPPHVPGMVLHLELLANDLRNAIQGPQAVRETGLFRSRSQNRFKPCQLGRGGEPTYQRRDFSKLSLGQQQAVLLSILLFSQSNEPLVIDQPEDNLDSEFIYKTFVRSLRRVKEKRQVIVVTHNANIAVLGDAELIVPLRASSDKSVVRDRGSIDTPCTKDLACTILEGASKPSGVVNKCISIRASSPPRRLFLDQLGSGFAPIFGVEPCFIEASPRRELVDCSWRFRPFPAR